MTPPLAAPYQHHVAPTNTGMNGHGLEKVDQLTSIQTTDDAPNKKNPQIVGLRPPMGWTHILAGQTLV